MYDYKWDNEGNLEWRKYSNSFYKANLGKTFMKGEPFGQRLHGSATAEAISGLQLQNSKFFQNGSTISAWFPNALSFKNDILIEQAFQIGDFGTITLLLLMEKFYFF